MRKRARTVQRAEGELGAPSAMEIAQREAEEAAGDRDPRDVPVGVSLLGASSRGEVMEPLLQEDGTLHQVIPGIEYAERVR
jgi:hypothetical protein